MKIAVWYHIKPTGPEFGIDTAYSLSVFAQQMGMLEKSGLYRRAQLINIGMNEDKGILTDGLQHIPIEVDEYILHGKNARSELPTLHALQKWLPGHEDWLVCYFHAKGITHPHDALNEAWRHCMERAVIWNWHQCVLALNAGYDCAGAHWLTREKYGTQVKTFFFGGNFFWAKASFLLKLPPIKSNSTCREDDFKAETWIGEGPRPKVKDFRDHWPSLEQCRRGSQ